MTTIHEKKVKKTIPFCFKKILVWMQRAFLKKNHLERITILECVVDCMHSWISAASLLKKPISSCSEYSNKLLNECTLYTHTHYDDHATRSIIHEVRLL